jgi:hypothetical protein
MATTFVALMTASVASAAPVVSLQWVGTSGTGTAGSNSIEAAVGDVLVLDIRVTIDATGLGGVGDALVYNSTELLPLLGYGNPGIPGALAALGYTSVCPNPPNGSGPDTCSGFSTPSRTYTPLLGTATLADNNIGPGSTLGVFDAVKASPPFATNGVMTVGRAFFQVVGGVNVNVSLRNDPLFDGVTDSAGNFFLTPASATAIVPEPTTAALLGLGIFGLAVAGRRRS